MAPSNEHSSHTEFKEFDSPVFVEQGNGAVLLDIAVVQGKSELGETNLKLSSDGHTVLVPQPSDDPNDPLNWSSLTKGLILGTIAMAAF